MVIEMACCDSVALRLRFELDVEETQRKAVTALMGKPSRYFSYVRAVGLHVITAHCFQSEQKWLLAAHTS